MLPSGVDETAPSTSNGISIPLCIVPSVSACRDSHPDTIQRREMVSKNVAVQRIREALSPHHFNLDWLCGVGIRTRENRRQETTAKKEDQRHSSGSSMAHFLIRWAVHCREQHANN